jgi:hypothetical protein
MDGLDGNWAYGAPAEMAGSRRRCSQELVVLHPRRPPRLKNWLRAPRAAAMRIGSAEGRPWRKLSGLCAQLRMVTVPGSDASFLSRLYES